MIDLYFAGQGGPSIQAGSAWRHVYELLLWIDQTTGLAHCYESDKSQPGKNWYARSLAFHDWLSSTLGAAPGDLHNSIDWLFLHATDDLTASVLRKAAKVAAAAKRQRAPYDGRDFPEPGEDPELVAIIEDVLGNNLGPKPSAEQWKTLVQRIRSHLALENKRKNLLGEGFEDVITEIVRRSAGEHPIEVLTRRPLNELPGFSNANVGGKPNKVDVAIIRPDKRILVTAKWSVRADRERQFVSDYGDYLKAESHGSPWEYAFVTSEFDPARLRSACDLLAGKNWMFEHVVHISTDALRATYGDTAEPTMRQVLKYIDSGRLVSLDRWLEHLQS